MALQELHPTPYSCTTVLAHTRVWLYHGIGKLSSSVREVLNNSNLMVHEKV